MKVKKLIIRALSLALAIVTCFTLAACTGGKGDENYVHTTKVKKTEIAEYGNYVFCRYDRIFRFNRKTESYTNACVDIECEGMCPVDCVMGELVGAFDEKMYFCGWQQYTHKTFLAYQDIKSGDTKVVKELNDKEDPLEYLTFIEDGYWYYKSMVLKEGGDPENTGDYESYICRVTLDGKKDEKFIKCEGSESLKMVADGKIITLKNYNIICTIDIETKERKEVYDLAKNGYKGTDVMSSVDGKVYFAAVLTERYIDQATSIEPMLRGLLCMDINTGEIKRLVDEPIVDFCLTDDAVYYVPFKLRVSKNFLSDPKKNTFRVNDETLYACDLDGKNIRKVYTDSSVIYCGMGFTVIDGFIYGWMSEIDEETLQLGPLFFGGIEIETGRLIKTKKPEQ